MPQVLASVTSQPVSVLLSQALANSDNVLAEALAREVAAVKGGAASFSGVDRVAAADHGGSRLRHLGDEHRRRVRAVHGGQDPDQAARPGARRLGVAQDRCAIWSSGCRSPALPAARCPTGSATPESAGGKGWIRAKTGSLEVTYALAGTVLDQDGRVLVFAFVSTGVTVATRPAQDAVAAVLRNCGCA